MSKQSADPAKGGNDEPKKKQSRWLSIPNRKKIVSLDNQGLTIQGIMKELGLSYWQIYNVVSGRTKRNYGARSDKGRKRKGIEKVLDDKNEGQPLDLMRFTGPDDFLKYQTLKMMEETNNSNLPIAEKIKVLKDCSGVLRDIHNREMQNKLKRGDAEILAQIIRRFLPDATDDQIILIYSEELQKYEASA